MKNFYQFKNKCKNRLGRLSVISLSIGLLFSSVSCMRNINNCTEYSSNINNYIKNGRFYDQKNWYSVKIPESYQYNTGAISDVSSALIFMDPFGNLQRYEVFEIPEDILKVFPQSGDQLMKELFYAYLGSTTAQFPNTTIIQENFVGLNEETFFAIVNIPQGDTVKNLETDKRKDSKRGYFVFQQDKYIVILSNKIDPDLYKKGNLLCFTIVVGGEDELDVVNEKKLHELLLSDLFEMKQEFRMENK